MAATDGSATRDDASAAPSSSAGARGAPSAHRRLGTRALPDLPRAAPRRHEPRWPAIVALFAAGAAQLALPDTMNAGPPWLVLAVVVVLTLAAVAARRMGRSTLNEVLGHIVSAVVSAGLLWAIWRLIQTLPTHREPPIALLRAATLLWGTTVLVFASWYWRLDAGGPNARDARRRAGEAHTRGAFLFPQMTIDPDVLRTHCDVDMHWSPEFVDYLFLAFTASTAFSPTDVPVLSRWAKVLMMLQAIMSLATIALLAARAVNIL
jgi:hypothetical protein